MANITCSKKRRSLSDMSDDISIHQFTRSITRICREIEEQERKKRFPVRRFGPGSIEAELKEITMLDSILSPYELLSGNGKEK